MNRNEFEKLNFAGREPGVDSRRSRRNFLLIFFVFGWLAICIVLVLFLLRQYANADIIEAEPAAAETQLSERDEANELSEEIAEVAAYGTGVAELEPEPELPGIEAVSPLIRLPDGAIAQIQAADEAMTAEELAEWQRRNAESMRVLEATTPRLKGSESD